MYNLLIRLMVAAALLQLGISASKLVTCHSRACVQTLEARSRDVLRAGWKPIEMFPKEAHRFE